jgi:hypothetical protein
MLYKKTPLGQEAMKTRGIAATQAQRAALIMVDGQKTDVEILAAMSGIGLTEADIAKLVELGCIEPVDGESRAAVLLPKTAAISAQASGGVASAVTASPALNPLANESDQALYQRAYPIATKLTSGLGLRGFRLNLSLESAGNYSDLVKLAPKIQDAVGDAKYAELKSALRL